jgi:hypothetical protein
VLVVQIDRFDAEALEARVAASSHVFRFAAHSAQIWFRFVAHDTKLRREKDLVANAAKRFAHQHLVVTHSVCVGGIQKGDSQINRAVNRRDRFGVIAATVKFRHAHAAKSESGNQRTVRT